MFVAAVEVLARGDRLGFLRTPASRPHPLGTLDYLSLEPVFDVDHTLEGDSVFASWRLGEVEVGVARAGEE